MGLFSLLFGNNNVPQYPQIQSIYPQGATLQVRSGKLPTIQADKLVLKAGETCHYVDIAVMVTEKKLRKSQHIGGSFRILKGVTLHTGDTVNEPITEPEFTKGILCITNNRVVFVAKKNGFDKKTECLTAISAYPDGVDLQFGNKTYILLVNDGNLVKKVLDLVL